MIGLESAGFPAQPLAGERLDTPSGDAILTPAEEKANPPERAGATMPVLEFDAVSKSYRTHLALR
jgi:hypothetical protein